MIAYRAETAMCGLIKDQLGHPNDVRALLRDLFQMEANLLPDPAHKKLAVEIHHMANPQADRAVATLLEFLNKDHFVYPGSEMVVEYKQVST